jgi:hypothetical protein
MMSKSLTVAFLSLLAVAPAAQDAVPASAAKNVGGKEITLPVKGLSTDNGAKVERALTALTFTDYVCPDCDDVQAKAGECSMCEVELEARKRPTFKEVTTSTEKLEITFHLAPEAHVRLSNIETAIMGNSVEVQREKLHLRGPFALVYTGGSSVEDALLLEKAFRAAKFADAKATYDKATKEIHLRFQEGKPSWATFGELGSKLAKPLKHTDVIFGRAAIAG